MLKAKAILAALTGMALIGVGMVWYGCISSHRSSLKPISQSERLAISKAVASLPHLIATNISDIQRLQSNKVRVYTKATSGTGGDMLELEEEDGVWLVRQKGAWME